VFLAIDSATKRWNGSLTSREKCEDGTDTSEPTCSIDVGVEVQTLLAHSPRGKARGGVDEKKRRPEEERRLGMNVLVASIPLTG
jgi:hypothetical protein